MYKPGSTEVINTDGQGPDLTAYYKKAGYTEGSPAPIVPAPTPAPVDSSVNIPGLPGSFNDQAAKDAADLKTLAASIGVISDQEAYNMKSEASGMVSGQFDPLINDAIEKGRQGNAAATVRGGQRGGFENTQVSGAAAVAPTEGGTFTGQGGQLEKVASAYQTNIDNLKVQKQAAINAAYAELRKAKISGQQANFDNATKLFEVAQKASNDAMDLAVKKNSLLQSTTTFAQSQNDRAVKNSVASLVTIDESGNVVRPSDEELQKFATSNGLDQASLYAEVNKKFE
jgi:hypothetical protein